MKHDLGWNHNNHYHSALLEKMPAECERALDVGCGYGEFARKLSSRAQGVVAIDRSPEMIRRAKELSLGFDNLTFIEADVMEHPLEADTYDFVSAIAVVHHLPFAESIDKMKAALRSGGVLAILGLYKERMVDLPRSLLAFSVNQVYLRTRAKGPRTSPPIGTFADPSMTMPEIRKAAKLLLPGADIKDHLLWRYSLIWRKQ